MSTKAPSWSRKGVVLLLVGLALGLVHWTYLTWDTQWRVSRLKLTSERAVSFKWNRGSGFTQVQVHAYSGNWLGATLLRQLMAVQLKPSLGSHCEKSTWQKIDGDSVFTVLNVLPVVLSDSWGTDSTTFRDPEKTPLMFAAETTGPVAVQKLIQSGAYVNARDQNGESALIHAMRNAGAAPEEVKLLLAAGADVNQGDRLGNTPLMKAAQSGQMEVISILLAAGADAKAQNNAGDTACVLATQEQFTNVVELLHSCKSR